MVFTIYSNNFASTIRVYNILFFYILSILLSLSGSRSNFKEKKGTYRINRVYIKRQSLLSVHAITNRILAEINIANIPSHLLNNSHFRFVLTCHAINRRYAYSMIITSIQLNSFLFLFDFLSITYSSVLCAYYNSFFPPFCLLFFFLN